MLRRLFNRAWLWLDAFLFWLLPDETPQVAETRPHVVDNAGVIWLGDIDQAECWVEDHGQHDMWKKAMRLALWRFVNQPTGAVDLQRLGITDHRFVQPQAPLFPLHSDLAAACRRLGFERLAVAAWSDLGETRRYQFYMANQQAVSIEANRRFETNIANIAAPLTARSFDTVEETIALLGLGHYTTLPEVPPGKAVQPLTPLPPLT